MERRPLGATGLLVTPIGLGLAALGRPAYIDVGRDEDLGDDRTVAAMERRAHAVLDDAFDLGVRYVDVARSYGRAEEFLASWLDARALGRDEVTVGSKWGYTYVGEWRIDAEVHEVKDHSAEMLRRQAAESRAVLGDRLALYQIHSAMLESGVLDDVDVLDELTKLHEEQGLVIGITTSGPRQGETIRRALEVGGSGAAPFGAVQATWNVLEPSSGAALADAHDAGWGVFVKEAMANGRLGPRGAGAHRQVLDDVAARHGVGVDAVAIAAALGQPWADVVLSGAVTDGQLRSNVAGHEVQLSEADLESLRVLTEPADLYWERRSKLSWA